MISTQRPTIFQNGKKKLTPNFNSLIINVNAIINSYPLKINYLMFFYLFMQSYDFGLSN